MNFAPILLNILKLGIMGSSIYKNHISGIGIFLCIGSLIMMMFWWIGITPNSDVSLKMNTGLCFFLLGINLAFFESESQYAKYIQGSSAILSLIVGFLSLTENIFHSNIGIDTMLFIGKPLSNFHLMSAGTAFCFLVIAVANIIELSIFQSKRISQAIQLLFSISLTISFISIVSHFYTISMDKQPTFLSTMSPFTAFFFISGSIGNLLKNSKQGFISIFTGERLGSSIARKLFTVFIPLYLCIGFAFVYFNRSEVFSSEFEVVILVVTLLVVSSSFFIYLSILLNKVDEQKSEAFADLNYVNVNLETIVEESIKDLKESNNELSSIKNALNETSLVSITNQQGVIIEVNEEFCNVSKYDREELIGNTHAIINSKYHDISFWKKMWKTIASGNVWKGDIKNKAKDGSYYWVHTAISPIRNHEGKIDKYISVRQDITERKEAEESLLITAGILNSAEKIAKLGGWELDLTTGKTKWTDQVYRIHEVGKDFDHDKSNGIEFYHPEYRPVISRAIEECMQYHTPFDVECKFITAKKNERWVRAIGEAIVEGEVAVKIVGVFQDITEVKDKQREIEISHHRTNLATKAANVGVWEYDIKKNELFWDNQMYQLYGIRKEDSTNTYDTWYNSLHESDKVRCAKEVELAILGQKTFDTEFRIHIKDSDGNDKLRSIKALAYIIKNEKGEAERMVGTNWDITDQIEQKKILKEAKKIAERANQAKSEFLANMSHEIRTPLNGVIGFSDLLLRTQLNGMQKDYLQSIHLSAKSLLEIINDILDFSKIEAGKMELNIAQFDIHDLIAQIGEMIKYQLQNKNVELLINMPPKDVPQYVWGDELRIKQILINLLSNSIKFTKTGEIELKVELLSNNNFKFSVRDTGIGISKHNQQGIFSAFSQADESTTRQYGGTGLGLAISNRLLSLMNSKLDVESTVGLGSIFSFECYLKHKTGALNKSNGSIDINKVLIIDDNKTQRAILSNILDTYGIESRHASNGFEALDMLSNFNDYDLIFMDYHMPDINGIETTRKIVELKLADTEKVPIVLFHSITFDNTLNDRMKNVGIKYQMSKPIDNKKLNDCLKACGSKKRYKVADKILKEYNEGGSFEGIKVLIAEDNPINMKLAKSMVGNILPKSTILEAKNGKEAIDIFHSKNCDLVITDIQMPEMNGYEVAEEIRKTTLGKNTPIIALTAGTVKGEEQKCIDAGMNHYVPKPVTSNDLKNAIAQWLPLGEKNGAFSNKMDASHFDYELLISTITDKELINELISELKPELEDAFENLIGSFEENNLAHVKRAAHRIKGSAMSLHLNKLRKLSEQLENVDTDDYEVLDYSIKAIKNEIDYIIDHLYSTEADS